MGNTLCSALDQIVLFIMSYVCYENLNISVIYPPFSFQDNVCIETQEGFQCCKLIAVHAGLGKKRGVEEQLIYLRGRDTRIPRVDALSGRKDVWEMPEVYACSWLKIFYFQN